jgi:putative salt-induced outer membrane protein
MTRLNHFRSVRLIAFCSVLFCSLLGSTLATPVLAQEEPKSLLGGEKATAGSEDVATSGFEAVAKAEESPDTLEIKLSAGGLSTGGNAESLALTAASKLHYRHDANQLSGAVVGNYGRAKPAGAASTETTVENLQGKVRYDRFITKRVALFGAVSILTNRFLGLDYRLNLDPGLAYYFVDEAKHRMWAEMGYDLQYDLRREDAIAASIAAGTPLDRSEVSHNGRLFVGYENNLSDTFALDTGLEYLQRLSETENWRLNWDLGLTSNIAGNFSLATTFNLRYDHNPLPGIEKTDYTTAISLVYQLL